MEYVIKVTRLFESSWNMIQGNKVNQGIIKKFNFEINRIYFDFLRKWSPWRNICLCNDEFII
jgi:hypothetical protein